jgi:hypothetical protein
MQQAVHAFPPPYCLGTPEATDLRYLRRRVTISFDDEDLGVFAQPDLAGAGTSSSDRDTTMMPTICQGSASVSCATYRV